MATQKNNDNNMLLLNDAKTEYTNRLISILQPSILNGIVELYEDSVNYCESNNSPNDVLFKFQDTLKNVHKWSEIMVKRKYSKMIDSSKCEWFEDLVNAIFICYAKMLTLVNSSNITKKIKLRIPKPQHFVHLCYISCTREIYQMPYLFDKSCGNHEYISNMKTVEGIINKCILDTIRRQLPMKHIIQEYLLEPNTNVSLHNKTDIVTGKPKLADIEKLVKKYMKTLDTEKTDDSEGDDSEITKMIREIVKKEMNSVKLDMTNSRDLDDVLTDGEVDDKGDDLGLEKFNLDEVTTPEPESTTPEPTTPKPTKEPEPESTKEPEPTKELELEPAKELEPETTKELELEPETTKELEPETIKEPEPEPTKELEPEPTKELELEPETIKEPEPEPTKELELEPETIKESEPESTKEPEPKPTKESEPEPEPEPIKEPDVKSLNLTNDKKNKSDMKNVTVTKNTESTDLSDLVDSNKTDVNDVNDVNDVYRDDKLEITNLDDLDLDDSEDEDTDGEDYLDGFDDFDINTTSEILKSSSDDASFF